MAFRGQLDSQMRSVDPPVQWTLPLLLSPMGCPEDHFADAEHRSLVVHVSSFAVH